MGPELETKGLEASELLMSGFDFARHSARFPSVYLD